MEAQDTKSKIDNVVILPKFFGLKTISVSYGGRTIDHRDMAFEAKYREIVKEVFAKEK